VLLAMMMIPIDLTPIEILTDVSGVPWNALPPDRVSVMIYSGTGSG